MTFREFVNLDRGAFAALLSLYQVAFANLVQAPVAVAQPSAVPPPPAFQGTVYEVSPSSNVQAVINAAAAGDTIFFDAGSYGNLTFSPGILYISGSQTYPLLGQSARASMPVPVVNSNVTIYGVDFSGGAFSFNGHSGVTVTHATFSGSSCYINNAGLSNSTIQWSTFNGDMTCGSGNFRANITNVTFTHNYILSSGEGLPITPGVGSSANGFFITFNYITNGAGSFTLEYAEDQAPSTNFSVHITDNWFETSSFGPSIVSAGQFEFARNFLHRIQGTLGCFGGIEVDNASPHNATASPNIHNNYYRNDSTDSNPPSNPYCNFLNAGAWGLYSPPFTIANENYWHVNASGYSGETGATTNDNGIPSPLAAGAAP